MELKIDNLLNRHSNIPCVIIGAGYTMMDFDYANFKGIKIATGSSIMRFPDEIDIDYLVSANNHFPVLEINEHLKYLNKKNISWLMSDTACYNDIWDFNKKKFEKLKINYFCFDDRHFDLKRCKKVRNCCKFLEIYPKRKTFFEYLGQLKKLKYSVKKSGATVAEPALGFALLFGCNPIFTQGVDLPLKEYGFKKPGKKYVGYQNNKADMFLDRTAKLLKKKYFFYYLKNLDFMPYLNSFFLKVNHFFTKKSFFAPDIKESIQNFKWMGKIAEQNKIKIYNLSNKSLFKKKKIFDYINKKNFNKKFKKYF